MMMATRNDIKDRLIHNQSPFPTKDKVLSYTIPIDHTESLLFCNSSSSSSSSSSSGNNGSGQDNGSLNFIASDDDPCNGRDSLASFLDEGLGTSLDVDGVDEIASPIFPTLGRNDSGVFSSDEGNGVSSAAAKNNNSNTGTHNHASLIPQTIQSPNGGSNSGSSSSSSANISASNNNNVISVAEVVSWKSCSSNLSGSSNSSSDGCKGKVATGTIGATGNILLSPPPTATISVVTDSVTGIPSIICTSHITTTTTTAQRPTPTAATGSSKETTNKNVSGGGSNANVSAPKLQPVKGGDSTGSGATTGKAKEHHKTKSMPLGRQGPQKCTICDKVFSNASALTKHKLTHSDERRHACATCGKAFKRQDHLNGHMLTHRNKKPFECKSKGCGKSYCDARSLRRHVENRHGHEVLESMNLTNHKQGNKGNTNSQTNNIATNGEKDLQPEPQPELVQFAPIKVEPPEHNNNENDQKLLDCMPVLQPEPQLESGANSPEKTSSSGRSLQLPLGPPVLKRVNESLPPSTPVGIPVVVKRENVSVFDFDESMEDSVPTNVSFSSTLNGPTTTTVSSGISMPQQSLHAPEKSPVFVPPAIKVSSIQGAFPDMRLIQELAKRFGDSKVALFLASPPTGPGSTGSSIAQIGSIQLDGQNSSNNSSTLTSQAFLPSENGLFSVTPISIVPTSSGDFTFKPATISMSTGLTESPKPLYIVPSEPFLSTGVNSIPQPPPAPAISIPPPPPTTVPKNDTTAPIKSKESKSKSEIVKEKLKSGIGATLANRIKSKLKAGTLKRLGKAVENHKMGNDSSSPKLSHQSPANTVASSPLDHDSMLMTHTVHNQNGLMQTIQITAPGGGGGGTIATWCESPKDCIINGMEEDRLSEGGADGDDKPVECSICSRRFKNTPALNGHMRLHGGYFKKETEGTKKKEVTKEHAHSTPLQTASVSVRALIEEKIKERRNNLLKLAAAAEAEKAAAENGSIPSSSSNNLETTSSSQSQSALNNLNKSARTSAEKKITETNNNNPKLSHCTPAVTVLAQQQQLQSHKIQLETPKLKVDIPSACSEKDRNCDQPTIINNLSINNNNNNNTSLTVNTNGNNNNVIINPNNTTTAIIPPSLSIDPGFADLSIFIGDGVGLGSNGVGQINQQNDLMMPPTTTRDPLLNHNQYQHCTTTSIAGSNGSFPVQMDKSSFTFLDCGASPEDLCQAFHLIYVDGVGVNSTDQINDQDMIGKVAKLPLSEIASLSTSDNQICQTKSITDSLMCPPSQETCNMPWEWRNSVSSENTDSGSLSNVQDCISSLFCSSSSDTPDESCTKDPVAGGGYCYTPILSPNSSFCLTPGPDSPFEAGAQNQSLSFICPSPSIGSSSVFSDPSVSSLINAPSSVEQIFSPEQHSQPPSVAPQVNITPTAELQKYSQIHHQQQQFQGQSEIETMFTNGLENFNQNQSKQSFISVSHIAPTSVQQPPLLNNNANRQEPMDCLPAFNTLASSMNDISHCNQTDGSFIVPKDIVVHCPMNINMNTIQFQQSSMVPFEVFATSPLPKKISEKWLAGKAKKNGKIRTGSGHQADLPSFRGNKARLKSYKTLNCDKLWDPCVLEKCSYEDVDKYLDFACCSAVPGGGMNKEYALHLLTFSKGNIREALLRLMEKLPTLPAKLRNYSYTENQRWTSEEIMVFQISLIQVGKDFARISKAIGTKHEKECVSFYYFWKKVCPNEYQVMKQIWRDRLDHQLQQEQQSHHQQNNVFITNNNPNNSTMINNNNVSFLVPAQEFRGISICK